MFIKVGCGTEAVPRKPIIFELRDSATILDLKKELQQVVNTTVDKLEIIKKLKKISNGEKLSDLAEDPSKIDSTVISLFKSGVFDCSLQLYSDFVNLHPVEKPSQYPQESDSVLSIQTLSSCCSIISNKNYESPENRMNMLTFGPGKMASLVEPRIVNLAGCCKQEPMDDSESDDGGQECPDPGRDCCNRARCDKPDTRPPYAITLPENRRFGLVITNEDPTADTVDERAIMRHFFNLFENCQVDNLNFSDCTSMAKFCSNLLMVCKDDRTADWITSAIEGVCPPHSCLPFIEFFRLIRASFVLPLIVPDKSLCSIFELLELQNCGLVTDKWTVMGRNMLCPSDCDYEEKAVSALCDNEEIIVYLDAESKRLIMDQCSKLKYCFWRLYFNFSC